MELVDEPGRGRVFEHRAMPGIADAIGDFRVRVDALARWLQDVAYLDVRDAGFRERGVWIVRRCRIRVEAFPRFAEPVVLRTFCSGVARFAVERRTSIRGERGALVEAVASWIWLDAETMRPARFPPEFLATFEESARERDVNMRLRQPAPPEGAEGIEWRFRADDVDVGDHINNSHYWAPLEEEWRGQEVAGFDGEIEYRDAAQPGPVRVLSDGAMRWIAGEDGSVKASIELG